jgi:hypothetical protein
MAGALDWQQPILPVLAHWAGRTNAVGGDYFRQYVGRASAHNGLQEPKGSRCLRGCLVGKQDLQLQEKTSGRSSRAPERQASLWFVAGLKKGSSR